ATAAMDAGPLFRMSSVEPHAHRQVEGPVTGPDQILIQFLNARLMADRRVAIWGAGRRLRRILTTLSVHLIEIFRLCIVRLQFVVGDRPGGRHATMVLELAEILLAEPQQHRAVDFGVPADVVVDAGMEGFVVLVLPALLGFVLALDEDRARIPVVLLARQIAPTFQRLNWLGRRCEVVSQSSSLGSAPD